MIRLFRYLFIIILTLACFNILLVPLMEPGMLYEPNRNVTNTPQKIGLDYEDLYIKTSDGKKINAWYIPKKGAKQTFLVFHGNASNIGEQMDWIRLYHAIGVNVFIFDYHGYGKSEGEPAEASLYLDGLAAYTYIIQEKKLLPSQIILVGNSLGGAVAIDLASKEWVGGLVVRSTFTSLADSARHINPFYRWPILWLSSKFDSLSKMARVKCPTVIFHSIEDERFPFEMAAALYKKAPYPKRLVLLEKGEHDYFYPDSQYVNGLRWAMRPID